LLSHT